MRQNNVRGADVKLRKSVRTRTRTRRRRRRIEDGWREEERKGGIEGGKEDSVSSE